MSDPVSELALPYNDFLTTFTHGDWQQCIFYMTGRVVSALQTFAGHPFPDHFQECMEQELVHL